MTSKRFFPIFLFTILISSIAPAYGQDLYELFRGIIRGLIAAGVLNNISNGNIFINFDRESLQFDIAFLFRQIIFRAGPILSKTLQDCIANSNHYVQKDYNDDHEGEYFN